MRAVRYFGQTPDYWWDNLTVPVLKGQNKELAIRPPLEEWAANDHGYVFKPEEHGGKAREPDVLPESDLPEFEP